ncbi:unnamed protein product [Amaranthus hypochondriacus]
MKMVLKQKSHFLTLIFYFLLFLKFMSAADAGSIAESEQMFIKYNDLKIGKETPIYFGGLFSSKTPKFLPKEMANLIPFSSQKLSVILQYFGFVPESSQAQSVESTLKQCEMKFQEDEKSICVNSMESMIDFVSKIFKNREEIVLKMMSTTPLPETSRRVQKYKIMEEPQEIESGKVVECIMLPYPYAVYECYLYAGSDYKVLKVKLKGEDGVKMEAMVNCHMNTSGWDPNDGALRVLGLKPGGSPVCQFLSSNDMVWFPATALHSNA